MKRKKTTMKRKCDGFFDIMARQRLRLGYGDVLLEPGYSEILPKDVDLSGQFSRRVFTKIPIISSPMDTVTGADMAIAMAMIGGIGIIHKNLTPEEQASAVGKVKHKLSVFITDPICIRASSTVNEVLEFVEKKKFTFLSFPVFDDSEHFVGVVGSSDFEFCKDRTKKISEIMSTKIISGHNSVSVEAAYNVMMDNRIKFLPVFNRQRKLMGIYTLADVKRIVKGLSPDFNLAPDGTLIVGAAIGVGDDVRQRMELLAKARVDVVVIDAAHGDSKNVLEAVRNTIKICKREHANIDVVAGNISSGEAAKRLVDAGADGIRVGQGAGSICTTRIVTGVGRPQITAIYDCDKALRGSKVPCCADGGVEHSGHMTMALAAGAKTVMLGSALAGAKETPGDIIFRENGTQVKIYRGMGSLAAMRDNLASRQRYGQGGSSADKLVAEGVEGEVDFKGEVSAVIHQLLGGLRSGMAMQGARTIDDLQRLADFGRITPAGLRESHPNPRSFARMKDAPNYKV